MKKRGGLFWFQLGFTLLIVSFLIVPVILSMLAGLTVNYQTGLDSGLTFRWVAAVWEGYRQTIFLSIGLGLMGMTYGALGSALAELFPTAVRYTGASLTFNLAGLLGGSLAPYIATYLASDEAAFTTGQMYMVDGGMTI